MTRTTHTTHFFLNQLYEAIVGYSRQNSMLEVRMITTNRIIDGLEIP